MTSPPQFLLKFALFADKGILNPLNVRLVQTKNRGEDI